VADRTAGLVIIAGGLVAVTVGLLVYFGAFSWFGRLPGDLRIEGQSTRVFIPFTSMLLLSLGLSALLYLVRRFL
jgi:hypothetical protein